MDATLTVSHNEVSSLSRPDCIGVFQHPLNSVASAPSSSRNGEGEEQNTDSHFAQPPSTRNLPPHQMEGMEVAFAGHTKDVAAPTPLSRKRLRDDEDTDSDASGRSRSNRTSKNLAKFKSLMTGMQNSTSSRPESPSNLASLLSTSASISMVRSAAGTPTRRPPGRPKGSTSKPQSLTRPGTPNSGASKSNGWSFIHNANSRYSTRSAVTRGPELRPLGPRHLEYDYTEARKEFTSAAYYALGKCGWIPPKGPKPGGASHKPAHSLSPTRQARAMGKRLPTMKDLKEIPAFRKACERLDKADRALEEALAKGQTWENTPVPPEYSLAALTAEELTLVPLGSGASDQTPFGIGVRSDSSSCSQGEPRMDDGSAGQGKFDKIGLGGRQIIVGQDSGNDDQGSNKTEEHEALSASSTKTLVQATSMISEDAGQSNSTKNKVTVKINLRIKAESPPSNLSTNDFHATGTFSTCSSLSSVPSGTDSHSSCSPLSDMPPSDMVEGSSADRPPSVMSDISSESVSGSSFHGEGRGSISEHDSDSKMETKGEGKRSSIGSVNSRTGKGKGRGKGPARPRGSGRGRGRTRGT